MIRILSKADMMAIMNGDKLLDVHITTAHPEPNSAELTGAGWMYLSHQLALLYKLKLFIRETGIPKMSVKIPLITQQEGCHDYGVYAIAYAYHAARKNDTGCNTKCPHSRALHCQFQVKLRIL